MLKKTLIFIILLMLLSGWFYLSEGDLIQSKEGGFLLEGMEDYQLELKTDASRYSPGDPVAASFIFINSSDEGMELSFNTSQTHELELFKEDELLWSWSEGRAFLMVITEKYLDPGEYLHQVIVIPSQVTEDLSPGSYQLQVKITCQPEALTSERLEIEIAE